MNKGRLLAAAMVANLMGCALLAQAQTTVAGKIPGQFAVSPSGAATYRIPIEVSPGVAGMQPQLALSYNSQAGNGLLGMGWGLAGLSAVVRCPRTQSTDGATAAVQLNNTDRFCLDGAKLLLTPAAQTYGAAGTQYRTELETFAQIEAIAGDNSNSASYSGPSSFRIKTKDGLTLEYGLSADARLLGVGKNATIAWGLSKITDRKGNHLSISYASAAGDAQLYPHRVDYGGNTGAGSAHRYSVRFSYETSRSDKQPRYMGGLALAHTKLLSKVALYESEAQLGEYRLQYQSDSTHKVVQLSQIQRCDGDNKCLAPVQPSQGTQANVLAGTDISTTVADVGEMGQWVDANGDGRVDFCRKYLLEYLGSWDVPLSCIYGDGVGFTTASPKLQVSYDGYWQWQPPFLDLNGDGVLDYCGYMKYSISDRDGPVETRDYGLQCSVGKLGLIYHTGVMGDKNTGFIAGDINGDGRDDYCYESADGLDRFVYCAFANGRGDVANSGVRLYGVQSGFKGGYLIPWNFRRIRDVNGDGLADFCFVGIYQYGKMECRLSTGTGFGGGYISVSDVEWSLAGANLEHESLELVDFNADGLPDLCGVWSGNRLRCVLNTGAGFSVVVDSPVVDLGNASTRAWADVNGDGAADFCTEVAGSKVACTLSAFDSFGATLTSASINLGSAPKKWVDANGDGYADYCRLIGKALSCALSNFASRRVEQIDGAPGRINITYQSIANDQPSKIYTKVADTAPTLPKRYRQLAYTVVARTDTQESAGALRTRSYQYSGLMEEVGTGRGYLGFRTHTVHEHSNGLQTQYTYEQNWPYIGREALRVSKVVTQNSSQETARTTTTWACVDPDTGASCQTASGKRYFAYPSKVEDKGWDLSGSALPSVNTEVGYILNPDGKFYGEVGSVKVSSSDGYSKTTTNEYYPADTNQWILGRLKRASVTSTTAQ